MKELLVKGILRRPFTDRAFCNDVHGSGLICHKDASHPGTHWGWCRKRSCYLAWKEDQGQLFHTGTEAVFYDAPVDWKPGEFAHVDDKGVLV